MLFQRRPPHNPTLPGHQYTPFVQREFQTRYIGFLLGAVLGAMLVAGGPSYYFLNQNYEIFTTIAYGTAPQLLQHLERERIWINSFLVAAVLGVVVFCIIFGLRLTSRIVRPLMKMERHMKLLTRGHWYIPEVQLDDESEFVEFVDTYNYFYKALRSTTQDQLTHMMKISVDRNDRDSQAILQNIVRVKSQQLGQASALRGEVELPFHDSRHVS
jgi:hypothetical protein